MRLDLSLLFFLPFYHICVRVPAIGWPVVS